MKKGLLLFTLVGLLTFGTAVSCQQGGSSQIVISDKTTYTVSIVNEAALKAEWHAKDADRMIELAFTKDGEDYDPNILMMMKHISIRSSNKSIAVVSGRYISVLSAGKVTITILLKNDNDANTIAATTSIELDIKDPLVEPDYKSGTITEVFAADDTDGKFAYYTSFYVITTKKDEYGYFTAGPTKDTAEKDALVVYGATANADNLTYDFVSQRYKFKSASDTNTDPRTKDIAVGDKLDVVAIRADHGETKEVKVIIRAINGKMVHNGIKTTTELNAIGPNANYIYQVTGKISKWSGKNTNATKYGNFYIKTADTDEEVYIYGATFDATKLSVAETGNYIFENPKDFLTADKSKNVKLGDTVTMLGYRLNYNGTKEFNGIITALTPAA